MADKQAQQKIWTLFAKNFSFEFFFVNLFVYMQKEFWFYLHWFSHNQSSKLLINLKENQKGGIHLLRTAKWDGRGDASFLGLVRCKWDIPKSFCFFGAILTPFWSIQAAYCDVVIYSCCIDRKGVNNSSTFIKVYYAC